MNHCRALNVKILFVLLSMSTVANAVENAVCHPETKWSWYTEANRDYYFEFVEAGGQTVKIYTPSEIECKTRAESIEPGKTKRLCDCEPGVNLVSLLPGSAKFAKYFLQCRDFDDQGRMLNVTELSAFVQPDENDPRSTCLLRAKAVESSRGFIAK